MESIGFASRFGIENHGLKNGKTVYWNLSPALLLEQAVKRQEGIFSDTGSFVVETGIFTGRSANDKYIIRYDSPSANEISWGKVNQSLSPDKFEGIFRKVKAYVQGKDLFVQDLKVGADPDYCLPIRVITEKAWHSLFARNMFIRISPEQAENAQPEYTVIACPGLLLDPEEDGTRTSTAILLDFERKLILICGTGYAGEIKKSIFSVMNYLLPKQGVLPMHCSANVGENGKTALFFGLSGTGKTTLSSSPDRKLIGDDEHGWGSKGIFNFEGGCYAKTIRLSSSLEPLIWQASQHFGTVLENVVLNPASRTPDFNDESKTENTRSAYPIHFVNNIVPEGYSGHPDMVFFLSADAFGVLPPISKLTTDQALYYFLSGYTAKLAGTERGLGSEPSATFSTCFGAPFLPLHPDRYARLLGEKINQHKTQVWLINTGWTGGGYGTGKRIHLSYTRAMIRAALEHQFDGISMHQQAPFGLYIPDSCPGVPAEVLDPQRTWSDLAAYQQYSALLAGQFEENFKQFAALVSPEVVAAGPHRIA